MISFQTTDLALLFLSVGTVCAGGATPQSLVAKRSADIVSSYRGVFASPPSKVPTDLVVDGPLLGNGDVGVVLSGPPEAQRLWISKNDFWKFIDGYPNGCPIVCGCLDLRIPALTGADYRVEQEIYPAEVSGTFTTPETVVSLRSWVSATGNLLVTSLSCGGEIPVRVSLALSPGQGDLHRGVQGDILWFTREAKAQPPWTPRRVACAFRILGLRPTLGADGTATFEMRPRQEVTIVAVPLTDEEAQEPLSEACLRVTELTPDALVDLNRAHREWWKDFWSRSFIEIPDKEIEKHWYAALYIMASCSRKREYPPGLFGNWITTDAPAWAGDYHLNYNHQAPWWGVYSSNHVDLSEPYDDPIMAYIPQGRENARQRTGCRGILYEVGIGPKGLRTAMNQFWGQKSNASYCAVNMLMRYYSTYDLEYARQKAYPFLSEVGQFWEDYLRSENGRYIIVNDAIHEADEACQDMNPLLSLGLIRMVFKGLLDMSQDLNADSDHRPKWQDILDHLSGYPVQERAEKSVFRYTEKGMDWCSGNTLGIQHVWPAGQIGLGSDPQLLEIARNTLVVLDRWEDGNGFATFYTAAARLGIDPALILTHLREQCLRHGLPNLWMSYAGGGIESCGGITTCVNEMLLQSHEGVLRFFPCWPKDEDARFGRLRAYGAFLVSGERSEGRARRLVIESEKGRPCTVQTPWPGEKVQVFEAGQQSPVETTPVSTDQVSFATRPGGLYRLEPGD